ncbi:MAG TPA: GDP-mannose 4,6-dehydratase [Candidatus Binatia bacterium]|jgi:dTDP-glucose 4,6-dehydratase
MKILVTGAGGFIGSHLTEMLLEKEHEVRALVRYSSRGDWGKLREIPEPMRSRLEVRLGDVRDSFMMRELVEGCDYVFHLAALIGIPYSYHAPASYVATNVGGALNVLEACRSARVRRVIMTSTSEVYGTGRYFPMDEAHPLQAQSPYAASKIAADKLAESYFCSFDTPVVILRPFNTYGPRQSARAVIPTILSQALSGAKEISLGNLTPERDLTYVEDTARAFVLAAETPGIEGQTIHFGQGESVSIGDLARRCLKAAGSEAKITSGEERRRPEKSEVDLLRCDASKARSLLGWSPRVALSEGLNRTAEYIRNRLELYRHESYVV